MRRREPSRAQPREPLARTLADLLDARIPLVLATVVEASGSTPAKLGGKMVVTDAERFGTVGGGAVEAAVIDRARHLLASSAPAETMRVHLTRDLAMCCGGTMGIFLEPMAPPPRVVLFGGGHVAEPLCAMATLAGFDVTVCDPRDEWLTDERFPGARALLADEPDDLAARTPLDDSTFVVVATWDHALDEQLALRLLSRPEAPRWLGMIGSRRKRERMRERLLARGAPAERVSALRIPIGLNLGAETPEEIAVAVVAELVAARRGVSTIAAW